METEKEKETIIISDVENPVKEKKRKETIK